MLLIVRPAGGREADRWRFDGVVGDDIVGDGVVFDDVVGGDGVVFDDVVGGDGVVDSLLMMVLLWVV